MPLPAHGALLDFEVYVLWGMKLRLSMYENRTHLQDTLDRHGLSLGEAERIHGRIADRIGGDASFFSNLKSLLGNPDMTAAMEFRSLVWPDYDFTAGPDQHPRYRRRRGSAAPHDSPRDIAVWGVDIDDFAEQFGPLTAHPRWPIDNPYLPNYQEFSLPWDGRSYGAGFSWGLFMFAAQDWD